MKTQYMFPESCHAHRTKSGVSLCYHQGQRYALLNRFVNLVDTCKLMHVCLVEIERRNISTLVSSNGAE